MATFVYFSMFNLKLLENLKHTDKKRFSYSYSATKVSLENLLTAFFIFRYLNEIVTRSHKTIHVGNYPKLSARMFHTSSTAGD